MDTKRGADAQDAAPRPQHDRDTSDDTRKAGEGRDDTSDDGAIPVEDLNSADDEGAN